MTEQIDDDARDLFAPFEQAEPPDVWPLVLDRLTRPAGHDATVHSGDAAPRIHGDGSVAHPHDEAAGLRRNGQPMPLTPDRSDREGSRPGRFPSRGRATWVAAAAAVLCLVGAAMFVLVTRWSDDGAVATQGEDTETERSTDTDRSPADGEDGVLVTDTPLEDADPARTVDATWDVVDAPDLGDSATRVLAALPSGVWLFNHHGGAWHSPDDGATWRDVADQVIPPAAVAHGYSFASYTAISERAGTIVVLGQEVAPSAEEPSGQDVRTIVSSSTDGGFTWRRGELGAGAAPKLLVADDEGFVALDPSGRSWRSIDGLAWTATNAASPALPGDGPPERTIVDVAERNGRLVAVGFAISPSGERDTSERAIWTSDDGGRTWEAAPIETTWEDTSAAFRQVVAGAHGLLAVGPRPNRGVDLSAPSRDPVDDLVLGLDVWFSGDGRTWTLREPVGPPRFPVSGLELAWGPAGFLIVGEESTPDEPAVFVSDNGASWEEVERPEVPQPIVSPVAATADGYRIIGWDGMAAYESDTDTGWRFMRLHVD
ncbi:MAG: sialidase family protein [Actinomycetota bacterium]|nr:sialidase family protein [Actinomycetota bacterium]